MCCEIIHSRFLTPLILLENFLKSRHGSSNHKKSFFTSFVVVTLLNSRVYQILYPMVLRNVFSEYSRDSHLYPTLEHLKTGLNVGKLNGFLLKIWMKMKESALKFLKFRHDFHTLNK